MRAVLQRVSRASVSVDGQTIGRIGEGILALVGFTPGDDESTLDWMADKIVGLRVFPDEQGKMNLSVSETSGSVLVVSQFTLYGDARKGRRPSFVAAAPPDVAIPLYESFVDRLRARIPNVQTGEFGAMMEVELVNDGPVTILLEH